MGAPGQHECLGKGEEKEALLGLPGLANHGNSGCPIKFKFKINNKYVQYKYALCIIADTLILNNIIC